MMFKLARALLMLKLYPLLAIELAVTVNTLNFERFVYVLDKR